MNKHETSRGLERLREDRVSVEEAKERIEARAVREGRDMHPDEKKEWTKFDSRSADLTGEIEQLEQEFDLTPKMTRGIALGGSDLRTPGEPERSSVSTETGVALGREERVADWQAQRPVQSDIDSSELAGASLGHVIRGAVTGDWKGAEVERRVLAEGVDATGGFVTPELLGAQLIDRIRNAARVFQAGASTVPVESDKQSIARLSAGVTPVWRAENAAVSEDDPAFERVTFTPRSLAVLVRLSRELFEDMVPGGEATIENEITTALALELDRVALRGSGTPPEPQGVRNQSGVEIQSLGANGATPTMADLINAVYGVRTDNIEPSAILWAPRTAKTFASLTDTTDQPLNYPVEIASIPRLDTGQIPVDLTQGTSNDTSEIYAGRWSDLLVGVRTQLRFEVLRERYADNLQYGLLATLRADIQLAHPEAFVVTTGVRP